MPDACGRSFLQIERMNDLLTPKKLAIRTTLAIGVLAAAMIVCSLIGTEHVSLKAVLTGPGQGTAVNPDYEIFVRVRIPRILLAAIVGGALACSGVVFQGLLRNPLADPYILGISSGAGLGAMIAVVSGISWTILATRWALRGDLIPALRNE